MVLPVAGDLEVGGRFHLEGNAGGEILACERPTRLSTTWEYDGISWLDATVSAAGGATLLTPGALRSVASGEVGQLRSERPDGAGVDGADGGVRDQERRRLDGGASVAAGTDPEAARAAAESAA